MQAAASAQVQHVRHGVVGLAVAAEPARGVGQRAPHGGVLRIEGQRLPRDVVRLGEPVLGRPERGEACQRGGVAVRSQEQRSRQRDVGVGVVARVVGRRGLPQLERAQPGPGRGVLRGRCEVGPHGGDRVGIRGRGRPRWVATTASPATASVTGRARRVANPRVLVEAGRGG